MVTTLPIPRYPKIPLYFYFFYKHAFYWRFSQWTWGHLPIKFSPVWLATFSRPTHQLSNKCHWPYQLKWETTGLNTSKNTRKYCLLMKISTLKLENPILQTLNFTVLMQDLYFRNWWLAIINPSERRLYIDEWPYMEVRLGWAD